VPRAPSDALSCPFTLAKKSTPPIRARLQIVIADRVAANHFEGDSRDSDRNRVTEALARGTFPKKFFTGDSAPSGRLSRAIAVQRTPSRMPALDLFNQQMEAQKSLWNRCFKHFEKIARRSAGKSKKNRAHAKAPLASRTTGSVGTAAYTLL
jgi:hypothetical protein